MQGDDLSVLSGTIKVTDTGRLYPIRRSGVSIPVRNGLQVADLDGNGTNEMLIGSNNAVYVLSKSGTSYQQSWVYPFDVVDPNDQSSLSTNVNSVAARDITGDGKQEIFFSKGGLLVRLDGVTRREAVRTSLRCMALKLADVDGDGSIDLVCLDMTSTYYGGGNKIVVLNPTTLAQKWATPELNLGNSFAIGNVDNDSALEIVTAGGYVFDGQTHQNEWAYSQVFGADVGTGDMDGDGVDEIVGMADWGAVRAYSAIYKSPVWEYVPTWTDMDTLVVADANGDGKVEAIVGHGQGGDVFAIGYNTAQAQPVLLWSISEQNSGVSAIAVGDVDGDGIRDIVWGSGWGDSGRDEMVVATLNPTISIKWTSMDMPQLDGGFYGGALARIGGGASRLLFSTSRTNSGYDGARAIALDPATNQISVSSQISRNYGGAHGFDLVDYDQDNVDELFLGTDDLYNGYFTAYDFNADTAEWQSPVNSDSPIAVTHADMNADGYPDLIGATTAYVYVYDVHAQTLLWKSTGLAGGLMNVRVADLDQDGKPEIIAALYGGIVIYGKAPSGTGYLERARINVTSIGDILVADLDGDNLPEIYTLESNGWPSTSILKRYDNQLQVLRSTPLGFSAGSLYVEDSGFARKNLLMSTSQGGYPYYFSVSNEIWAVDPSTGTEVWRSPSLPGSLSVNSLRFEDVQGNGKKAIVFSTGQGMFYTR